MVGTSGWQYADWRGRFYPPDLPQRSWLEHHAAAFATTEVNTTFYRLPRAETLAQWAARTPADYVLSVKASRFLTHVKRLAEPGEAVARLTDLLTGLDGKLGAVLLQLPPDLQVDAHRLDACLACFPAGTRVAVEPRHSSWWHEEVRAVLVARGAALVWADHAGAPVTPLWRTADWGYLRLHAGGGGGVWAYDQSVLATWAGRLVDTWSEEQTVYAYTNNDPGGAALRDAAVLGRLLHERGRCTGRVPLESAVAGAPVLTTPS